MSTNLNFSAYGSHATCTYFKHSPSSGNSAFLLAQSLLIYINNDNNAVTNKVDKCYISSSNKLR